ncbi:MAG: DNA replication/repair protein RecF, partial [Stellaceae bacterium]
LEAVSFLAPGRGLRGARLTEIDRRATGCENLAELPDRGWAVAADVASRRGVLRLGTGRDRAAGDRRVVRIDGEPARSQSLLGERLGIVWLTPAMDRLFLDGPGGRRRFLDRLVLVLDPAHAARVSAYEQALRERSQLLRIGVSGDRSADPAWLSALEAVMAAQGVAVAAARRDAVQQLDRACAAADGPFPRARLALLGAVEDWLDDMPALAAEWKFIAALAAARRGDAVAGGAALGPHRCDLAVSLAQSGMAAAHASTGEQKALLISILLAHAGLQRALRGEPPLLLLDEIAAHLDATRREALFEAIDRLASQVWLSGTDAALFAPLRHRAQFLSIHDGTVAATCF